MSRAAAAVAHNCKVLVVEVLAAVMVASITASLVYSVLGLRVVDPALQALTVLILHLVKVSKRMAALAVEFCRDRAVLAVEAPPPAPVVVLEVVVAEQAAVLVLGVLEPARAVTLQPTAVAAVAVGGLRVVIAAVPVLVALLAALAVKQLTLMGIASLGQVVIQQEFMGVFHDIFG
jgi:hypothetical protein